MLSLLTINWNPDPELFNFFGISIRYYGLLWIIGLAFAYLIVQHQYRDRKIDEKKFEPLFFYCFFGILHPPCQPDELRNHRQTDRHALGIHL